MFFWDRGSEGIPFVQVLKLFCPFKVYEHFDVLTHSDIFTTDNSRHIVIRDTNAIPTWLHLDEPIILKKLFENTGFDYVFMYEITQNVFMLIISP